MRRFLSFLKVFRYDLIVLLMALRHRDTPGRIKGILAFALLYLVSPVDIIPDAVPFAGLIDDAVIVPTVICGLTNLLPSHVRRYAETRADQATRYMPAVLIAASLFVLAWIGLIVYGLWRLFFA
ncbi:Protein of unknown function [Selenomonas sp. GACV-9]|uniref:YkvA family protein n=1 Tax=Selenomonas sp. GACV-9 TaxID=3158782 RepID=UPI0008EB7609|nr:Protein of unknown function [Selenomonas ruminantium]